MSEPLLANVTVAHTAHGDDRFAYLAELGGWSSYEALGRMVKLWARCTALKTDQPGDAVIRVYLGPRGSELLVEASLGERLPDGAVRVRGGGITGGDTERFGWYDAIDRRNRKGGLARADNAARVGGRFVAKTTTGPAMAGHAGPADSSQAGDSVSPTTTASDTSSLASQGWPEESSLDQPTNQAGVGWSSLASQDPASGFRIPDQKNLPPARAIPPSTDPAPAAVLWQELEQARAAAAVELGVEVQPLTAFDVGQSDLMNMLADARKRGPDELNKLVVQARHAIAMAKREVIGGEQSFEWFTGAVFSRNNFRRLAGKTATPTVRAPPRRSAARADRDHQSHQPPRKTTIL